MKRVVMAVSMSALVAASGVAVGLSLDLGGAAAEAQQARTKRPARTKRGGGAAANPGSPAQATSVACGGQGQPKCPLEAWMEDEAERAAESGDAARLAAAYEAMARFAPDPSWNEGPNSWRAISEAAAAKAKAGDVRGARAACKQCHQAWRERYRAEHRARPLPR
jgi:hypothetical protein